MPLSLIHLFESFKLRSMRSKSISTLAGKLQELYNNLRDYSDQRGRTLSTPFMKLPLKSV